MSEQLGAPGTKRREAQELLARGVITREEYESLRAHWGWGAPKRSRVATLLTVAPWVGYGALAAGAILEIVAQYHPELTGPLEQLSKALEMLSKAAGL